MSDLTLSAILAWVIFGLVVGLLARVLVPGSDLMGWLGSLFLGVVGSFAGGLIAYALKLGTEPYAPAGWMLSILGAVVALVLYSQLVAARRGTA
jgi:uncharacterized membrane protein YeaQ/YmgE (transglycosylase-associated protein family)